MPIHINKPELDARLDALAEGQPARVSRSALAEAWLEKVATLCEQQSSALAWMDIGKFAAQSVPPTGRADSNRASNGSVTTQITTDQSIDRSDMSQRGNAGDSAQPTER